MSRKMVVSLVLVGLLLTACGPQPAVVVTPTLPAPTTVPPTAVPPTVEPPTTVPPTQAPEPSVTPIPVDLTPAQLAAMQALAAQLQIPVDQITLVSTEAVDWPNGCLGVVHLGMLCTQNVVPGFRIIFSVSGQQYEYHTNANGTVAIEAPQNSPFVSLVMRAADNSVQLIKTEIASPVNQLPADTGLLPQGGSIANSAYVLDLNNGGLALALDENGSHPLSFIQNPTYGLAVWPGGAGLGPTLAWGTQYSPQTSQTQLFVGAPDGTQVEALVTDSYTTGAPYQLVAERWDAANHALYFSQEPSGIGGYILFGGASSLYRVSLADKSVTEVIPFNPQGGAFLCLDAMSLDNRLLADHCTENVITVRDLSNGQTSTVTPPADLTGYGRMGGARFSPDGQRLAFALAKGDPDAEQGWVAVSDSLSGTSHLILTSAVGQYYTVAAWLNDNTLLLQSTSLQCGNGVCPNELWTVAPDGSNLQKVADGSFIAVAGGLPAQP